MATWEFPEANPIDADISLLTGSITIVAEPTEVISVSLLPSRADDGDDDEAAVADVRVEYHPGRLKIAESKPLGLLRRDHGFDLVVRLPADSRCMVRTTSSVLTCQGELGSLDVKTAAGSVGAAQVAGPVRVSAVSASVRVDHAGAEVQVHTASGDIELERVGGEIVATTASGRIQIGTAAASVTARTSSGHIRVGRVCAGAAELTGVSGDITVGVAPGVGVYLDLASVVGQVSSELDPTDADDGTDLRLKCRTVNGALRVARAVATAGAS
jgi:DUF4097 and DUF4098 domain-containing protein YvlB